MEKIYCYNKDGWCDEDNCRCHINYFDTPEQRKSLGDAVVDLTYFLLGLPKSQSEIQHISPKVWDENFPTKNNAVHDSGYCGVID